MLDDDDIYIYIYYVYLYEKLEIMTDISQTEGTLEREI